MKKIFPSATFAIAALLFTSCSKVYTCTCTISGMGARDSIVTVTYRGVSHNSAANICDNTEAAGNTTGYTYSCHL